MKRILLLVFSLLLLSNYNTTNNYDEIVSKAQKEHQNIVVVFSGSDWCPGCIKLKKNVLDSVSTNTELKQSILLYTADFPRNSKLLDAETKHTNEKLADAYNENGIFPLVVLLDENQIFIKSETRFKTLTQFQDWLK